MFCPLKFICWDLIPNVMLGRVFGGAWNHEWSPHERLVCSRKNPHSPGLLHHERTQYRQPSMNQEGVLTTGPAAFLILDFQPLSETVKINFCFIKPPSPWNSDIAAPNEHGWRKQGSRRLPLFVKSGKLGNWTWVCLTSNIHLILFY